MCITVMDKLHYYVCQTDQLLAKYVKIGEADSGHILELDKTMENMRFMTNMDDQYMNVSDNKEDGEDDVEDIHPDDKLVNYFNNGNGIRLFCSACSLFCYLFYHFSHVLPFLYGAECSCKLNGTNLPIHLYLNGVSLIPFISDFS
jgi:hypothetical protein